MIPRHLSTRFIHLAATLLIGLAAMGTATAAPAAGNTLQSIDTVAVNGHEIGLRLHLAKAAPKPSVFTVDDPARLAIDLPDTALGLDKRFQSIDQGPIRSVSSAAGDGRTRVVVKLTRMLAYHIQRHDKTLTITFGGPAASAAVHSTPGKHPRSTKQASTIRSIDFHRGAQGAGRIDVTLNGDDAPVDLRRSNGRIIARLPGVSLPPHLAKRYDVTDFATPVKTIDAMSRAHGTRLVITPNAGAQYQRLAYQTGNHLYIELQPLSAAEKKKQAQAKPKYTGKKISLSFQNIPVRAVLQIIANVANVNMVVSDNVSGTIALQLDHVPWDQALDIILNAKGLGMTRTNNVITVAPLSEIVSREKAQAAARAAASDLAPLHSEIIQVNYAQAASIAQIIRADGNTSSAGNAQSNHAAPGNGNGGQSLLSPRGHITVDDRTNSLLVTDTQSKLDQIRSLVHRLDIPVRQVLIQSRIVIANRDFTRNLGISETGINGGASKLNNALASGYQYGAKDSGYTVSLPVSTPTSTLATSIITDTFSLNLELSAMETENNGEIISSPRVITADGQEANIEQGREIPYQSGTVGSNQGTSVQFKKAVLGLDVTPKITPNKKVIMKLKVTQDSVGQYVPTSQGGSVPSIDTRSLTTQVLVNNGDTVVLGGIFEQTNSDEVDGVPYLRKVPLLGALFKNHSRSRNKRELLIFVTPHILDNKLGTAQR